MTPLMPPGRAYFYGAVIFMLMLFMVTEANARPFPPRLVYAYELANEHWGGPPTGCSSVSLEIGSTGVANQFEGIATLPKPGEAPQPCFIKLLPSDAKPNMFERACAVIRHEAGHLHGLEHSDDPSDIMYPTVNFVPSQCVRADLFLLNHPGRFR